MREPFPEEPRFLLFQFRFQTAGTYSAPPPHQSKVLGREGRGEGNLSSERFPSPHHFFPDKDTQCENQLNSRWKTTRAP
nr:MAG TPA: hypothetical protein [Caudoviricetes sp.]